MTNLKIEKRYRRHKKIRSRMSGTKEKPRLCVFRSLNHIYCQLVVDDEKSKTMLSASDLELKKTKEKVSKAETAKEVGKLIAKKALEKKIEKVVFDRGGYQYHGRVKALADGARESGLKF